MDPSWVQPCPTQTVSGRWTISYSHLKVIRKNGDIDQLTKPGPKPTLISEDFSNTFARLRMLKQLIKRAPLGLAGGWAFDPIHSIHQYQYLIGLSGWVRLGTTPANTPGDWWKGDPKCIDPWFGEKIGGYMGILMDIRYWGHGITL